MPGCECPANEMTPRSLEFLCETGPCPESVDEAVEAFFDCTLLTIREGCGQRVVQSGPNFTGFSAVFDAESGELIGAVEWSDVSYGDCRFGSYLYGVAAATCNAYTECSPCPTGGLPACE